MSEALDLFERLEERKAFVDRALRSFHKHWIQCANADHDYREALTTEMLRQREAGTPVTILRDICLGLPSISSLRLKRDIEEAEYKAAQEAIQVYKLQIRLLEAQIDREYRG